MKETGKQTETGIVRQKPQMDRKIERDYEMMIMMMMIRHPKVCTFNGRCNF